jgi:Fe2+ transport system protein FeoA
MIPFNLTYICLFKINLNRLRTILDLKKGEVAKVERFADEALSCKLLTLGILPEAKIRMIRKAPFGGAYYLKLNGHNIAVRENEAASIIIKES